MLWGDTKAGGGKLYVDVAIQRTIQHVTLIGYGKALGGQRYSKRLQAVVYVLDLAFGFPARPFDDVFVDDRTYCLGEKRQTQQ